MFDPLTGTPKNNRWDKFWINLGFGAFLNAVKGKGFAIIQTQIWRCTYPLVCIDTMLL